MPKIHSIRQNEVKNESSLNSLQAEQCHQAKSVNSISLPTMSERVFCRPPMVKQYYNTKLKLWLPVHLHPDNVFSRPEADDVPAVGEVKADP